MPENYLQEQWLALVETFSVGPKYGSVIFAQIVHHYSEPHRHYHTLAHIQAVLELIEQQREYAFDLAAVKLAAWFHDIIYDTREKDNEEKSADFAVRELAELGLPSQVVEETGRLILLTKQHTVAPDDTNGLLLLDADLAILGAAPDSYAEYARQIRQEYSWVPEESYRTGRTRVLEHFLQRQVIYHVPALQEKLEQQARLNLAQEIALLAS